VESGGLSVEFRSKLARKAFFRTAAYDAAIVGYLEPGDLPERLVLPLSRAAELRYGENPHQGGAAYRAEGGWWSAARQLQGKEMSFNNLVDTEAAWRLVNDLRGPAVAVIKHTNACGAAEAPSVLKAFEAAWAGDPLAAFGGVVAVNGPLDRETAVAISEYFVEVVIAPEVTAEAAGVLAAKQGLRVLEAPPPADGGLDLRRLEGGFAAQLRDTVAADPAGWDLVAGPALDPAVLDDLRIAWTVGAHTKSNAIVLASGGAAVGVGGGDQSRVGAARRAIDKAGERAAGAVAASDAFFPFRDGLDTLVDAGIVALAEPGGSVRQQEVIDAANERGVSLLFTGRRHFRH
jgi:phosphoribosylaminoimidazolecarboxamide formyltransferase/IMP cyclohydrolase